MVFGSLLGMHNSQQKGNSRRTNEAPLYNSPIIPLGLAGSRSSNTRLVSNKKRLISWYEEKSGELTAIINLVVGDIIEEDFFEPVNKKDGRNRVLRAEKFKKEVNLKQQDFATLVDIVVTGEGYGWMGKLKQAEIKEQFSKLYKAKGFPTQFKELAFKANFTDEDLVRPQKYRYIASSTVENVYDSTKIKQFLQRVAQNETLYAAEDVIHYMFYNINGRPYGFTSISTVITQLELLRFMWLNQKAMAENGGQPDRVYAVEDMDINNPSYTKMEQKLKKYVKLKGRHGSILLNGKWNVIDLKQLEGMQFEQMGLLATSLLAMQYRVPRNKLPLLIKDGNTKDDTGGNSEKSYWGNIEFMQDEYLTLQNKYLWIPFFGVTRKFKKAYKHDELIEGQIEQTRMNNLTFKSNEFAKIGKKFTPDYVIRYINGFNEFIEDDDLEDIPKEEIVPEDNSMLRQGLQSNKSLGQSDGDKNKAAAKKKSANTQQAKDGVGTSGFGKEIVVEKKEVQQVGFSQFIKLYNEDKTLNQNPPRVFFNEQDGVTKFKYMSTDFVYESVVSSNNVNPVMLMNFRSVIKTNEDDDMKELSEEVISKAVGEE